MKTTMMKQLLFFAVLDCMVVPMAAQTVDVTLQCGQTYTINSTVAATEGAGLTYRWLENGSTVTGNTNVANYTVPATKSVGIYTYIRQANTTGCADWQNSNAFTVEVVNLNDGICIAGITWAKYNVDVPGSFTKSIGDPGKLYQFNRTKIWEPHSVAYSLPTGNVDMEWSKDSSVCPTGWRIPTRAELERLLAATPVREDNSSGYWFFEDPSGGENIIWVGPISVPPVDPNKHLPWPLAGSIAPNGSYIQGDTHWWSTTASTTNAVPSLLARSAGTYIFRGWVGQSYALNVRCVK
jgi:hypothetical protein